MEETRFPHQTMDLWNHLKSLLQRIMKKNVSARYVWLSLENPFRDNKEARAFQLDQELRNITTGSSSVTDYCQSLKTISDLLSNIDYPVDEKTLVTYMINGLGENFEHLASIIRHDVWASQPRNPRRNDKQQGLLQPAANSSTASGLLPAAATSRPPPSHLPLLLHY